jgi:hypothetical protein
MYVDQEGSRYLLVQDPFSMAYYVRRVHGRATSRCKEITGSKDKEKVELRLSAYAKKHEWIPYPAAICSECAQALGKTWPEGHIATFYTVTCDVCGETVTCTEPRDWGHFNTVEEFQALYQRAKGGVKVE